MSNFITEDEIREYIAEMLKRYNITDDLIIDKLTAIVDEHNIDSHAMCDIIYMLADVLSKYDNNILSVVDSVLKRNR